MGKRFCRWAVVAVVALCASVAAALTLCAQCGWEQENEKSNFCSHCGASVKGGGGSAASGADAAAGENSSGVAESGAASVAAPANVAPDSATRRRIVENLVREDIELARRFLAENSPEAARAAFHNVMAIIALDPGAVSKAQREYIMENVKKIDGSITVQLVMCPTCNGLGKKVIEQEQLDGKTVTLTTTRNCDTCGGNGRVRSFRPLAQLKTLAGNGNRKVAESMRVNGRIKRGNVWFTQDLLDVLSPRDEALMLHAGAEPCRACAGFGKTDCRTCANTGSVPCPNKECKDGKILPPQEDSGTQTGSIKGTRLVAASIAKTCPTCNGKARIRCATCMGHGSLTCASCNGSGHRAVCRKCSGHGVEECTLCKGTGTDKSGAVCRRCNGVGSALCKTCGGDGYGK